MLTQTLLTDCYEYLAVDQPESLAVSCLKDKRISHYDTRTVSNCYFPLRAGESAPNLIGNGAFREESGERVIPNSSRALPTLKKITTSCCL